MISHVGDDECLKSFAKNWPVTIRPHKIKKADFHNFSPTYFEFVGNDALE